MPKLVFLDVDGTLVDYANRLPASAVDAIRRARAVGHLVYLTTGRSRAEMYEELWDIGIDGMIGGNGSYVEHRGEVVMHQSLTLDECRAIVDWLDARGLAFYLEANSGLYGSADFRAAALPVLRAYVAGKGATNSETVVVDDVFPEMIYGAELYRDDVNKISFVLGGFQDHLDSKEAFPQMKAGTWGGRGSHALFGDLGVANIDKAHAIEVLLEYLGADRADTVAMGDAAVDIPMLEYCAVGVAMGNSSDDVLAIADHITTDVEADGLYNAFAHLGLLEAAIG
ncbi:HAD family hydrolase [Tessaracoccus caeni]|uniref:HAD family hydrolase n=1 Tax=Tessaracoccus caeni TaxID=3031239 RepID=UPI0023DBE2D0|nr:HAD family hydrolase [Tessaracoccus caeni]MDF1489057.1 HAD family hydrolase [Tessaracoccus caeni]